MSNTITIKRIHRDEAMRYVEALTDLLIDCVEGGASVGFMLPLAPARAQAFWTQVAEGVRDNDRILLVAERQDGEVVGTVQLMTALPDNQPHRANIAKMLVKRSARRQGLAGRLMAAADAAAIDAGKSVLVLDTVLGGDAERLYERSGWQRVGSIPNYALKPDGPYCATTYFYKQLRELT